MTFDGIKKTVKDYCNLASPEADTRVGEAVNRHYQRVTAQLGMDCTRFVTRSMPMTVGVRTVVFSGIEKIDRVIDTTSGVRLVTEGNVHKLRSSTPGTAEPCEWAPQNTAATSVTIITDTQPQTVYTLQADGSMSMAYLTGDDEPLFAESFHDVLTWSVLAEELLKKEKVDLSDRYEKKAEKLLSQLVHYYADSPTRETRQGSSMVVSSTGSSGVGSGSLGATAYTQSALVTYDLGAGVAPFAVAQATAAMVANLDADKLDGEEGSFYLDRANHVGAIAATSLSVTATDRLLGRDTAGSGAVEELTVSGGLEFTTTGGIRTTALTGDVTKSAGGTALTIAADAVTNTQLANMAASLIKARKTASTGDPEDCTLSDVLDLIGSAAQGDVLYRGASGWERLGAGTSGTFLQTLGAAANPQWATSSAILDRDVTATSVTNTGTETTVYTYSVTGNALGSTKTLRVTHIGDLINAQAGSQNTTFKVTFGGTTVGSVAVASPQDVARYTFVVEAIITAQNATNAQRAVVMVTRSGPAANGAPTTAAVFLGRHTGLTLDTTGALTLAITVQHTETTGLEFIGQSTTTELL